MTSSEIETKSSETRNLNRNSRSQTSYSIEENNPKTSKYTGNVDNRKRVISYNKKKI